MSNAVKPRSRPSTARKVTPRTEAKRDAALNKGFRINLRGEAYEVHVGDVSNKLVAEMRTECHTTPMQLFLQMEQGFLELDEVAMFIWLARKLRGEVVGLDDIEVTYDDMFADGFFEDAPDGETDPEA